MPKGLERRYGQGHLHFITFSCYHRLPLLKSSCARNLFVEVLGEMRVRHQFSLVGYVVMPEHVHLLIGEPVIGTPSSVVQILKQLFTRGLRGRRSRGCALQVKLGVSLSAFHAQALAKENTEEASFWQRRFYDFNVWSRQKKNEKLHYMHNNPVKRGLVAQPADWLWSSYRFYARAGQVLISLDVVD